MGGFWVFLGLQNISPLLSWASTKTTGQRSHNGSLPSLFLSFCLIRPAFTVFVFLPIEEFKNWGISHRNQGFRLPLGILEYWRNGATIAVARRHSCASGRGHPGPTRLSQPSWSPCHHPHYLPGMDLTAQLQGPSWGRGAQRSSSLGALLTTELTSGQSHQALPRGWVYSHGGHRLGAGSA